MQASEMFVNLLHLVLFARPGKQGSALLRSLGLCEPVLDEELEQRPSSGRGTVGILGCVSWGLGSGVCRGTSHITFSGTIYWSNFLLRLAACMCFCCMHASVFAFFHSDPSQQIDASTTKARCIIRICLLHIEGRPLVRILGDGL